MHTALIRGFWLPVDHWTSDDLQIQVNTVLCQNCYDLHCILLCIECWKWLDVPRPFRHPLSASPIREPQPPTMRCWWKSSGCTVRHRKSPPHALFTSTSKATSRFLRCSSNLAADWKSDCVSKGANYSAFHAQSPVAIRSSIIWSFVPGS